MGKFGGELGELFKEFPFTIALGLVMAGTVAWFGARWWVIVLVLIVAGAIGTRIDKAKR